MPNARPRPIGRRTPSPVPALALAVLVASGGSAAHASPAASPPPDLAAVERLDPAPPPGRSLLVVHYHRPDGDYGRWNVWAWADDAEGAGHAFTRRDAFGGVAIIPLDAGTAHGNFLIRRGEWEMKDIGHDRRVVMGEGRVAEVWLVAGDPTVYTDPAELDFSLKARAAFLDAADRVRVSVTRAIDTSKVDPAEVRLRVGGGEIAAASVQAASGRGASTRLIDVTLRGAVKPEQITEAMELRVPGLAPIAVRPRNALNAEAYAPLDAVLGPRYTPGSTSFRTWSPLSTRVELLLYAAADDPRPSRVVALDRGEKGLWETTIAGDLHGRAYQLRFHHRYGDADAVPDVHAFAATPDSLRSVVVDPSRTDPEGFDEHAPPVLASMTDEVIYEIHVRDYSVHDRNVPEAHRAKYLGLTHLTPEPADGVTTSLSHLKDLGVTAVHLLPIQDFGGERHDYNWGYWTSLFNVPESQYSTTPHDPAHTIRELKQTIQTLHGHGVRVIMDVVYNHTSITGDPNPYEAAMPGYFLRTTDAGELRNDAGTGNSVADERPMVRKYILDSLEYWVREYRIDGFRFDLVGTHRPETVAAIARRLRAIRPDLTLYGEPWTGGGPLYFGKGAQRGLGFAVFNDHFRNAVRGDLDGTTTGFATGPGGDVAAVRRGLAGAIDDFTNTPAESVNYVSAHDNRTFWDKLVHTHPGHGDAVRERMVRLAHGMVLTAQGVAFLHGGADFARTKGGNHNSYNAGDAVNRFDWARKRRFLDTHRYLAGLIELRRAHPAFRADTIAAARTALRPLDAPEGVVAFALDGRATGDTWSSIVVAFNGEPTPRTLRLPRGTWTVVVDDERAGVSPLGEARRGVDLPPYSMWVGHRP